MRELSAVSLLDKCRGWAVVVMFCLVISDLEMGGRFWFGLGMIAGLLVDSCLVNATKGDSR